ncbi:MAG: molecular chaperone [Nitrospirae bacterium]|nr:molecular chaperone [Nitrospirota bacterium]
MQKDSRRFISVYSLSVIFFFLLSAEGFPANFSVSPIRIFFDGTQKTNVLTVKNMSDKPVSLEIKTVLWEHDQTYSPTGDIIFFPRMLTMGIGEEKIIRIGHKMPQGQMEKTYRMFISEMPEIRHEEGATLQIVMNLGVPIFIGPSKPSPEGEIEKISLSKSKLNISLKNSGNVHFIIKSIKISGKDATFTEVFNAEMAGWYLLSGNSREYTFEIEKENCLKIKNLHIDVETDRVSMGKDFVVSNEMCAP